MATDSQTITAWLTTSGIKIIGIVIGLVILSQISRWSVRKRIKNRFDEEGIQIPYPHRILFWGEPQEKEH